jgi:MtN3 and saliva related transmembrane protein
MTSYIQALGYIGCSIMSLQGVPQLWLVYRTKSTKDLSYATIAMSCIGGGLTVAYGILISEPPIYATVSFTLCVNALLLFFKMRYDAHDSEQISRIA